MNKILLTSLVSAISLIGISSSYGMEKENDYDFLNKFSAFSLNNKDESKKMEADIEKHDRGMGVSDWTSDLSLNAFGSSEEENDDAKIQPATKNKPIINNFNSKTISRKIGKKTSITKSISTEIREPVNKGNQQRNVKEWEPKAPIIKERCRGAYNAWIAKIKIFPSQYEGDIITKKDGHGKETHVLQVWQKIK